MKYATTIIIGIVALCVTAVATADHFGTGENQFTIDFVTISGDASSANGTSISQFPQGDIAYKTFTDPSSDFRMGVYEITNDQWSKFQAELGLPLTGSPSNAYDEGPDWPGTNAPTNRESWYEAAQFVNWLNTSTGHHEAYSFTGTQGTGDYTLTTWSASEADGGTNLYRHADAFYFLPTEDEFIKAAYWNGAVLQTYATPDDSVPAPGIDANYNDVLGHAWDVGSGSEELNGTFDMMGNFWEWVESPYTDLTYATDAVRGVRGASYLNDYTVSLTKTARGYNVPEGEYINFGFRVASKVPEPATMSLLVLGGVAMLRRRG